MLTRAMSNTQAEDLATVAPITCNGCRVGRWKDAVTANIRAYKADMDYTDRCMVAYGPEHNTDMLIYAANMAGMVSACCLTEWEMLE